MSDDRSVAAWAIAIAAAVSILGLSAHAQTPAVARVPVESSADNPLQLKPDHVTISVADIDKVAAWYARVLGFKEVSRTDQEEFRHRQMSIPGVYRVDLSWQKGSVRHTVGSPSDLEQGWRHIVFSTPDPEHTLQLLRANDIAVRTDRNPKTNAISQMFIVDPEGNEIELQPR